MQITWSKPTTVAPNDLAFVECCAIRSTFPEVWRPSLHPFADPPVFRRFHLSFDGWSIGTVIEARRGAQRTYFAVTDDRDLRLWGDYLSIPTHAKNAATALHGWKLIETRKKALSWAKKALSAHVA